MIKSESYPHAPSAERSGSVWAWLKTWFAPGRARPLEQLRGKEFTDALGPPMTADEFDTHLVAKGEKPLFSRLPPRA